jgi:hypothetical protein
VVRSNVLRRLQRACFDGWDAEVVRGHPSLNAFFCVFVSERHCAILSVVS